MTPIKKDEWYTPAQLADTRLLPFSSRRYIVNLIKAKKIKAVKIGKLKQGIRYKVRGDWFIQALANLDELGGGGKR